jgi:serine/threonine protein kinase
MFHDSLIEAFPEYKISLPELGSGNFKLAYKAESSEHGTVVLKIVKEPLPLDLASDSSVELPVRFEREILAMSRVRSDFVVRLLAGPEIRVIGTERHVWYLEPYLSGGTLDKRTTEFPNTRLAVNVVWGVLEAINALWSQAQLVHRDIKPQNIGFDEAGRPVVLDLGIAFHKELSALTDMFGVSPRTPLYAAPEQFVQRRLAVIDFRTDLFLAGVVGFEILTGRHPFFDPNHHETYVSRLMSGQLDKDAWTNVSAPDEFLELLRRLMRPRPNQRYRDLTEPLEISRRLKS